MQRINPPSVDPAQENPRMTEPPTAILPYKDSPELEPPSTYSITHAGAIAHASEDPTQEAPHMGESPLDPPPPEPPPD
jgi:hypothetical protein